MKNVSKIKLKDADVMTDSEMKYIFGGTGFNEGATGCALAKTEADCTAKCEIEFPEPDGTFKPKPSQCTWESEWKGGVCQCVYTAPSTGTLA